MPKLNERESAMLMVHTMARALTLLAPLLGDGGEDPQAALDRSFARWKEMSTEGMSNGDIYDLAVCLLCSLMQGTAAAYGIQAHETAGLPASSPSLN